MAGPDEHEDDDSVSLNLYRARDWSQPRSWLALLGLGLTVGMASALLGGLATVFLFDRPVATIDSEFLAYAARLIAVAMIAIAGVFATIEVGVALWNRRDRDSRRTRHHIDSFKGRAILSILHLIIIIPLLIGGILVLHPNEPRGNDLSGTGFVVAVIVALVIGPRVALIHFTHGGPPSRDIAD